MCVTIIVFVLETESFKDIIDFGNNYWLLFQDLLKKKKKKKLISTLDSFTCTIGLYIKPSICLIGLLLSIYLNLCTQKKKQLNYLQVKGQRL